MTSAALARVLPADDSTDEAAPEQAPALASPADTAPPAPAAPRTFRWLGWQEDGYAFDLSMGPAHDRLKRFLGLGLTLLSSPQLKDGPLHLPLATVTESKRAVLVTKAPGDRPHDVFKRLARNARLTDADTATLRAYMKRAAASAWSIRGGGLQALYAAVVAEPFLGDVLGARNPLVRELHSRQTEGAVSDDAAHDFRAEQGDFFPLLVGFDAIVRQIAAQAQTTAEIAYRPGWLLGDMQTERVAVATRRGHRHALVNPWWLQDLLDTARNNDAAWTAATLTLYLEAAFVAAAVVGGPRLSADQAQDLVVHLAAASADQLPHIERLLRRCLRAHMLLQGDRLTKRRTAAAIEKTNAAIKAGRQRLPLTRDMLTGLRAMCREQHTLTGLALWAEVADYSAEQLCDVCAGVEPVQAFKAITSYVLRSAT